MPTQGKIIENDCIAGDYIKEFVQEFKKLKTLPGVG